MNSSQDFRLHLLVIGARKCATTWLHRNLAVNPRINFSPKVKESGFFSTYFNKGADWYQSLFDEGANLLNAEIDTGLMCSGSAPGNVHSLYPDVKIVALVRKPRDHFRSNYLHAKRKGDTDSTPSDAWRNQKRFKDEVRYDQHLSRWMNFFSKEKMLIVYFEEIMQSPAEVISAISGFVGVDSVIDDSVLFGKVNVARSYRFKWLTRLVVLGARILRRLGVHGLVNWVKSLLPQTILYRDKVDEFVLDTEVEQALATIELQQTAFLGNYDTVGNSALWADRK